MKKILLLGGSAQQIIAIETAKRLGYYTVLCDYLSDNPGQHVADKFYLVSTTDKEAVLNVAREENIDGILAYASDPAAPTAAYVAEKLHLPTNPFKSVDILCNKDKFRKFLSENGFHTPYSNGYSAVEEVREEIEKYNFPIIIKPVDSSGSKGVTVVSRMEEVESAIEFGFSYSRAHRIIIEEFIEKKHPYLIGGDIFVVEGKVVLWGLMNCHRDYKVNSLVPVGKSFPLKLDDEAIVSVKQTLETLVEALNFKNGAMNVELVVDENNYVWPIDVGPRCGGNMIPDLLGYIFNVDVVETSVKVAMGEKVSLMAQQGETCWATHNLHAVSNGTLETILFSKEIEPYIIKKCIYKENGDEVEFFDNASKALGIVFLKFPTLAIMHYTLEHISELIQVVIKE